MDSGDHLSKVMIWNVVTRFLTQGISIVTALVFTRLLSTEDYGKITLYTTWVSIVSLVFGLQTYGSIGNARIKYSESKLDSYLSSALSISFISFGIAWLIAFIFRVPISDLINIDASFLPVLVCHALFSYVTTYYSTGLLQLKRVEKNTAISVILAMLTMVLSLYFVLHTEERYVGKIMGSFIPLVLVGSYEIYDIFREGRTFVEAEYWKFCLHLTLPLIFHSLSGLLLSQSDRIMLGELYGIGETGIYGVTYNFASVLSVIWSALNSSWIPFYYDYKKRGDIELLKKKSDGHMIFFSGMVIGFLLCAPEVFKILAPSSYWNGIYLLPFIVLACYFDFLYSFPANFEFYHEKTGLITVGSIAAAGINIFLNVLLIPALGGIGAAIATLLSYVFLLLFHDINVRFFMKQSYERSVRFYVKGLVIVMTTVVVYYAALDLPVLRWVLAVGVGSYLLNRMIVNKGII